MNDVTLPSTEQARTLTDRIKIAVEGTWQLIREAYTSRTWAVLGYDTWDAYCTAEFGETRLRLPREERQEVVASLRESGLSTRAIASATGQSDRQVRRDLAGATFAAPDRPSVVGTDGRVYAQSRSQAPDLLAGDDWQQPEGPGFEATVTPPPAPPRAPDRQPRLDVARTVLSALTELRQTSESLQALTPAHLARQDEETRRIWAARLNTELEALHGFYQALIKENSQ
ncbi:hypothetical protein OG594_08740 [Streptomyces sp. NBC_01214]|uniref:hypothetical protein n=1 Tax=Streptomyces sp. NBC_01214 TaxID=2903777 RepID=UPI00224E3DFC|nr:hypothetical protein [Streptomyces sp. NBC_01214]MCX4801736.1 hypothetical protein [Streptomyces sp. NBC_01214]